MEELVKNPVVLFSALVVLIGGFTEAAKRTDQIPGRYISLFATGLGMVVAGILSFALSPLVSINLAVAVVAGAFAGFIASGIYASVADLINAITGKGDKK